MEVNPKQLRPVEPPRAVGERLETVDPLAIEKDRLRWLIKYKDTEFYVNLDQAITPNLGKFLEIKSRTWSRKDAENKSKLVHELLALLDPSQGELVTDDYIEIVSEQGE